MGLRSLCRQLIVNGLHSAGATRVCQAISRRWERTPSTDCLKTKWRAATAPKFVVLCYHRVGTGGIPFYSCLRPDVFESQIRFLTSRYSIVSLDEMLEELQNPSGRIRQSVVITFDDGYRGVYTEAFPILRKYNVPATIYLTADCIENGVVPWYDRVFLAFQVLDRKQYVCPWDTTQVLQLGDQESRVRAAEHVMCYLRSIADEARQRFCQQLESELTLPEPELKDRMLTWGQIYEMQAAGIRFGAHTLSHPVVSRISQEKLERELMASRDYLEEKLGCAARDFAFPFGQVSDCGTAAVPILRKLGYRSAATTCSGTNTPASDRFSLRRVSVGNTVSLPVYAMSLARLFLSGEDRPPLGAPAQAFSTEAIRDGAPV